MGEVEFVIEYENDREAFREMLWIVTRVSNTEKKRYVFYGIMIMVYSFILVMLNRLPGNLFLVILKVISAFFILRSGKFLLVYPYKIWWSKVMEKKISEIQFDEVFKMVVYKDYIKFDIRNDGGELKISELSTVRVNNNGFFFVGKKLKDNDKAIAPGIYVRFDDKKSRLLYSKISQLIEPKKIHRMPDYVAGKN